MAYDDGIAEVLRADLADVAGVEEKRMFGGLCFMLNGHMTCGITKDGSLMVRVGPDAYEALLEEPEARHMDFTGKPMKGMLYVNLADCPDAEDGLGRWVQHGAAFTTSLPPKKK